MAVGMAPIHVSGADTSAAHATALLCALLSMHQACVDVPVSLVHAFTTVTVVDPTISGLGDAALRSEGFEACWQWILKVVTCDVV